MNALARHAEATSAFERLLAIDPAYFNTHEASRVGDLEPMYKLIAGNTANLDEAIKLAYLEILTRRPRADELAEARQILHEAATPLDGMADLRWVLLNCHEFRFLP